MNGGSKENILKIIQALLRKTVQNGCSEAEALSAAKKVSELLGRLSKAISGDEFDEEICRQHEATERHHEVVDVADAIAFFCDCKFWLSANKIIYFGIPHDVEIATYLTDLCRAAMDAAFRLYLKSPERPHGKHGRSLRTSYMLAMADRLSRRIEILAILRKSDLRSEKKDRERRRSADLTKKRIIDKQFEALGIILEFDSRERRYSRNYAAYSAGWDAGGRINISPGIKSSKPMLLPKS